MAEILFSFDVCVCVCVCVCARARAHPGLRGTLNFWALNANSSKTVTATDFKFDVHVPRDSPEFFKRGVTKVM